MKCRFNFEDVSAKKDAAAVRKGPVRDPFQVEETRAARANADAAAPVPAPRATESDAPPEERTLGVGGFDEPPEWAQKPEIVGPTPDLDDVFAGRGLDVGGYQVGGEAPESPTAGPAVSDAFAIMTGGNAMSGSDEVSKSKKSKKGRARKEKLEPPMPGGFNGLPPDLSINPFGMPEDTMRGAAAPAASFQSGAPSARQQARPTMRRAEPAAPPQQSFQAPGPAPGQAAPVPGPVMGGAPGATPPLGMQGATAPPPGPGGPGAQPLGGGPERVRRPVPGSVPGIPQHGPRRQKTPRSMPAIPKPDLAFLSRLKDVLTPRVVVTGIGGLLVLFAVIYLLVGGNYFSNDARGLLEAAQRSMAGLSSEHIQAEILLQTEKTGAINTAVTIDVAKDKDLHAVYGVTSYRGGLEYVTASGKTYKRAEGGAWGVSTDMVNPDFTSGTLFKNASGARLVDKQPIDGVMCDHIAFEASPDFTRSLFPGVDVTESTQVTAEIWVDPQQKSVRHLRLDASNLETKKLGRFSCHVEAAFSGFNTPIEIKAPI
jgi:hypothetical protein